MDLRKYSVGVYLCVYICFRFLIEELHFAIVLVAREAVHVTLLSVCSTYLMCTWVGGCVCMCGCVVVWVCIKATKMAD